MKVLGPVLNLPSKNAFEAFDNKQDYIRTLRDVRAGMPVTVASPRTEATCADNDAGDRLTISGQAAESYELQFAEIPGIAAVSIDPEFFGLSPEDRFLIVILEKTLGIRIEPADEVTKTAKASGDPGFIDAGDIEDEMEEAGRHAEALKKAASFTAIGIIETADGKQMAIDLEFNLTERFMSETHMRVKKNEFGMVDPFHLNFEGNAKELHSFSFTFDLDAENDEDELTKRKPLFAKEKSAFQSNLDKVRIWVRSDTGDKRLFAVGKPGRGAVYAVHAERAPVSLATQASS